MTRTTDDPQDKPEMRGANRGALLRLIPFIAYLFKQRRDQAYELAMTQLQILQARPRRRSISRMHMRRSRQAPAR